MSDEAGVGERPAFIRPSSLQIAEHCSRAPWLANKYKESTENTRFGHGVDGDISAALLQGKEPVTPEGKLLIAWLRERFPSPDAKFYIQRKVAVIDPRTGEFITEGTPDLLVIEGKRLTVVDWKTSGQWWSGKISPPQDNRQQQAYLVGAGMEFDVEEAQIILAIFDSRQVRPQEGPVLPARDWWPLIDQIKAVPRVNFDGPEPAATIGEHCGSCYQKGHCTAFLLPALTDAPKALAPFTEERGLTTAEEAMAGLDWLAQADRTIAAAKKIRDAVLSQVNTFVDTHGPLERDGWIYGPVPTNGSRKAPTVGELEEMGLANLIKPGEPGVKHEWRMMFPKEAKKKKGRAA